MANRFVLNETSYHGKGAIREIATEVKGRGFQKCFVCSDPDLLKFGVTKKVTDVLESAGIPYEIYSQIKANPTIENVQTGVAAFKKSGADCIVSPFLKMPADFISQNRIVFNQQDGSVLFRMCHKNFSPQTGTLRFSYFVCRRRMAVSLFGFFRYSL